MPAYAPRVKKKFHHNFFSASSFLRAQSSSRFTFVRDIERVRGGGESVQNSGKIDCASRSFYDRPRFSSRDKTRRRNGEDADVISYYLYAHRNKDDASSSDHARARARSLRASRRSPGILTGSLKSKGLRGVIERVGVCVYVCACV